MKKIRTIYIFEGENTFTFLRGYPMQEMGKGLNLITAKHKGFFSKFIKIRNVSDNLVGQRKKLVVNEKILPEWEVVKVNQCYLTMDAYTVDINSKLLITIEKLKSDNEILKRLLMDEKLKNTEGSSRERLQQRMKKDIKSINEIRNLLYQNNDPYGFGSRYGTIGGAPLND